MAAKMPRLNAKRGGNGGVPYRTVTNMLDPTRNNGDDGSNLNANGGKSNAVPIPTTSADLCYINVSGKQYITTHSCLQQYPLTLLGSQEKELFWIPELKSYYFNRNRDCFESILTFYQTGREFRPLSVDDEIYEAERKFFKIEMKARAQETSVSVGDTSDAVPICCDGDWKTTRKRVHRFLMDPRCSRWATAWHILDIVFICISITLLVMETDSNVKDAFQEGHAAYNYLFGLNVLVIAFFTTDLLIRFVTWPGLLNFWKNLFNILDILSILPFYVSLLAEAFEDENADNPTEHEHKSYVVLRVCRIFRIVRVFKFIRHSQDLIMIIKVVGHAKKELCLLVLLLFIFSVSFGSLMYYIEHQKNNQFSTIMQGCWWAIVTITTIGYGDIAPQTWLGKVVGSLVLTMGIVFLALPMTIIVGKFSTVYEKEKGKE
ncbi:hypothetical protein ACHWQZ_G010586 [Mnemiopsis leidyi]